jgi:hypothetical protein
MEFSKVGGQAGKLRWQKSAFLLPIAAELSSQLGRLQPLKAKRVGFVVQCMKISLKVDDYF